MKVLNDIKEMLCEELELVVDKGTIGIGELEAIYKAVDIIKDIDTIMAMEGDYTEADDADMLERLLASNHMSLDEKSALKKAIEMMR